MNKEKVIGLLAKAIGYADGNLAGGKRNKALAEVRDILTEALDELTKEPKGLTQEDVKEIKGGVMANTDLAKNLPDFSNRTAIKGSPKAFETGVAGAVKVEDMSSRVQPQTVVAKFKTKGE
jgi:hypothetical protein